MEWLAENWFWVLVSVVFIGMHLFGHGGHGSHGKHDEYNDEAKQRNSQTPNSGHGHH